VLRGDRDRWEAVAEESAKRHMRLELPKEELLPSISPITPHCCSTHTLQSHSHSGWKGASNVCSGDMSAVSDEKCVALLRCNFLLQQKRCFRSFGPRPAPQQAAQQAGRQAAPRQAN
jgi:hypothetical protein